MNRIRVPDIVFKWTNCCRLCLSQESTIDLFSESSIIQHFPSKIRTCLNFLIYSGDPMPRKICANCCMKLNHWFEFRKDCIQTEKELRKRLEPYKTIAFVKEYFDKYMKYEKSSQDGSISLDSMSEYDEDELYEELGEDEGNVDMYYYNLQKEDENSSFSDNDKVAPSADSSNLEIKKSSTRSATRSGNGQNASDESGIVFKKEKEVNNDNGASLMQKANVKTARQEPNANEMKKKFLGAKDTKATARKCETSTGRKEQEIFTQSGTLKCNTPTSSNRKPTAEAQKLETSVECPDFQTDQLSFHTPHLMESGEESDDNDNFINPLSFVYTSLSEPQKEISEGECTASTSIAMYKGEEDSEKKPMVTPWKCVICNEYFTTMMNLKHHYNSADTVCGKTDFDLECGYCSIKFNTKNDYVEHQVIHINDGSAEKINLVKCNECDEEFESEIYLKQHKCGGHEDVGAVTPEGTGYVCSKCDQTFQDKELFEKHELIHNQQDIFNSIVTPQFTTFEGVEDESDQYDDDKRSQNVVRCFRCGKLFNSARELERHKLLKHKNPTPFFCRKCNLRFSARSQLLMHVRSHMRKSNPCTSSNSGSDNTCDVCNAKFFLSSDLQSHMKIHKYSPTEELLPPPPPPLTHKSCPIPESFGDNKIDLFARFKCSVCSKIFAHSGSIIRHGKNLHKGQTVYPLRLKRPVFLMKRARSLSLPTDKNLKIPQPSKLINSDNVVGLVASSIASSVASSVASSQQEMLEDNYDPELSQEPKWDQDPDNGKSDANLEFGTEKCPFCEKMFKPTYLPRHIKRNHRGEVLDPQMLGRDIPDDSLVCRYCLKSCSNPHNRRVHESIHYPVKMQCTQCKICGEKFYNKTTYESHVLSCKSVRCGKCNKIFFRHLSLKNHSCILTIPTEKKA